MQERHELQLRQRDIAERNVATEIRQLGASIRWSPFSFFFVEKLEDGLIVVCARSLGRVCQDAETREVLARVEKQVTLKLFILALLYKISRGFDIALGGVSIPHLFTLYFFRWQSSPSPQAGWLPLQSSTGLCSRRPGWPLPSR